MIWQFNYPQGLIEYFLNINLPINLNLNNQTTSIKSKILEV